MVAMEAATVRMRGSPTSCAAPRYAPTPTTSTSRALFNMVSTSVSKVDRSNVQVNGVPPKAMRAPSTVEIWTVSSDWMVVRTEMGMSAEGKPALRKSGAVNFCSACW